MGTKKKNTDYSPRKPRPNTVREKKPWFEDHAPRPRKYTKSTESRTSQDGVNSQRIELSSACIADLGEAVAASLMQNDDFRKTIGQVFMGEPTNASHEPAEHTTIAPEQDPLVAENEALKKEIQQYQLIKEASVGQFQNAQETIAELHATIEQKDAQLENMQQQLIQKNKIMNDAIRERDGLKRGYSAMENALTGISATLFSALNQPLSELETRLSIASRRKNAKKNDIKAAMTSLCALREALRSIDIGGGYSIEISPLIDEEQWADGEIVFYNDNIHKNGTPGEEVIVLSRGYQYFDSSGEEKTVKAEVEPQASSMEPDNTEGKENE